MVRTLGTDNFLEKNHVGVLESLEEFHLAKRCDGETVFLLLRVDALEGDDFVGLAVLRHKDTSVSSLADLEFLLVGIDVSHHDGCANGNRFASTDASSLGGRLRDAVNAACWRRRRNSRISSLIIIAAFYSRAYSRRWRRRRRTGASCS